MPPKLSISISIVTFNSQSIIGKTVDSLLAHLPDPKAAEIFLVDNVSTDATLVTLNQLARRHPSIEVIASPRNLGYGGGHNLAIRKADSQYHLICNPDITFHQDALTPMIAHLEAHPEIGILAPKVLNEDLSLQALNKRAPTVLDLALRRFFPGSLQRLFQARLNRYEMRDLGYELSYEVPFLSGSFLLVRTKILKEIQGFDEGFFMYFEDTDLCRRVQEIGYKTVYFPFVSVIHAWQRASHKNWKMMKIHIQSSIRYFKKWGWTLW